MLPRNRGCSSAPNYQLSRIDSIGAAMRAVSLGYDSLKGFEMIITEREVLAHRVSGRLYVATSAPEHATLASYKECVKRAYGSLRGVTFETVRRPRLES